MKVWTIQNEIAYKQFKNTGVLRANKRFIADNMLFPYNWMMEQMKTRIGLPSLKKIEYPVWAYQHKKPDLRFSGHLEKGTKGVLLELEVEPEDVLLSNLDDFNDVLNYGYIADNGEIYNTFYDNLESQGYCHYDLQSTDKKSDKLDQFKLKLFQSWQKIFDLEREVDEKWTGKRDEQPIQATMWEVKLEQVISIKYFIAR